MRQQLKSYFPDFYTSGALFSLMPNAPWNGVSASLEMDIAYLSWHSGIKPVSGIVNDFVKDDVLDKQKLADVLWKVFGKNWQRLWDAYVIEYVPIENYNVQEQVSRDLKDDRTITRDISKTGSVDTTDKIGSETSGKSVVDSSGTVNDTTNNNSTTTTNSTSITNSGQNEAGTVNYGKKVDTTRKVETTEDETTKVDYGKITDTDGQSDVYNYGFNSAAAVPTGRTIDSSKESQSGSDTTERKLAVNSDETASEVQSGEDKTTRTLTTNSKTSNEGESVVNGSGSSTRETKGDSTVTDTGSVDSTETIGTTTSDKTDDDTTDNLVEKEDILRTRKGNIGQNTYQELLRQEFELWKWNFYKRVFEDCDTFLTLSIYNYCY